MRGALRGTRRLLALALAAAAAARASAAWRASAPEALPPEVAAQRAGNSLADSVLGLQFQHEVINGEAEEQGDVVHDRLEHFRGTRDRTFHERASDGLPNYDGDIVGDALFEHLRGLTINERKAADRSLQARHNTVLPSDLLGTSHHLAPIVPQLGRNKFARISGASAEEAARLVSLSLSLLRHSFFRAFRRLGGNQAPVSDVPPALKQLYNRASKGHSIRAALPKIQHARSERRCREIHASFITLLDESAIFLSANGALALPQQALEGAPQHRRVNFLPSRCAGHQEWVRGRDMTDVPPMSLRKKSMHNDIDERWQPADWPPAGGEASVTITHDCAVDRSAQTAIPNIESAYGAPTVYADDFDGKGQLRGPSTAAPAAAPQPRRNLTRGERELAQLLQGHLAGPREVDARWEAPPRRDAGGRACCLPCPGAGRGAGPQAAGAGAEPARSRCEPADAALCLGGVVALLLREADHALAFVRGRLDDVLDAAAELSGADEGSTTCPRSPGTCWPRPRRWTPCWGCTWGCWSGPTSTRSWGPAWRRRSGPRPGGTGLQLGLPLYRRHDQK
ncbi:unnamed protein product [Prorocentrum cordatum]|uniref:Phospholipase B-like n=1 Tax=Prorocentrum cordatum TaxID=2364126 RepID=A0ABN9T683_9DINO|nr:unnamed protein product [Polarella glacialis]